MTLEDSLALFARVENTPFAGGDFVHVNAGFPVVGVIVTDEGLVLFDIGLEAFDQALFKLVREISDKPIKYLVYSHGHFDHCFGITPFLDEIKEKGWEMPIVIAHERLIDRFEKYTILNEYHEWINRMQFSSLIKGKTGSIVAAETALRPTVIVKANETYTFKLGKYTFELYTEMGETDDAIWMHVPEKKVIFAGDLVVSSFPNIGNPYKVQRYPKHWARAMEHMLEKDADFLVPGHGLLIEGADAVKERLSIIAEAMHFVHDEVVKRMNQGKWFEEIYHEMLDIFPDKFKQSESLRPIYGCYEFAIHAVHRLYHGWYNSGNPTDLFPSKQKDIAKEMMKVIGDGCEQKIIDNSTRLLDEGKEQMAMHVVDILINGIESEKENFLEKAYKVKVKAMTRKAKKEGSFIARNILRSGLKELKKERKQRLKKSE
ncbi:MAG: alkyl sulfatase dimerization domain-containing protein [Candidatus Hodarchaeota archaeon]